MTWQHLLNQYILTVLECNHCIETNDDNSDDVDDNSDDVDDNSDDTTTTTAATTNYY